MINTWSSLKGKLCKTAIEMVVLFSVFATEESTCTKMSVSETSMLRRTLPNLERVILEFRNAAEA